MCYWIDYDKYHYICMALADQCTGHTIYLSAAHQATISNQQPLIKVTIWYTKSHEGDRSTDRRSSKRQENLENENSMRQSQIGKGRQVRTRVMMTSPYLIRVFTEVPRSTPGRYGTGKNQTVGIRFNILSFMLYYVLLPDMEPI